MISSAVLQNAAADVLFQEANERFGVSVIGESSHTSSAWLHKVGSISVLPVKAPSSLISNVYNVCRYWSVFSKHFYFFFILKKTTTKQN